MVSIQGLEKWQVLRALHANSKAQGMSFLHDRGTISEERAKELTSGEYLYFDYVDGRVIKCDLAKDSFDPWLFDRDLGAGAAARAINQIRS